MCPATHATYKRSYQNYLSFHSVYYGTEQVFPIKPVQLAQFIAFQIQAGFKGSSIQTQVAGISFIQRIMGFKNPSDHLLIKKLLVSAQKSSHSYDKRLPITLPILRRLLHSLPVVASTPYFVTLYRAMYLLAFYALLRVGEMSTTKFGAANLIQFHDVEIVYSNRLITNIRLHIRHHKHSKGMTPPLLLQACKDKSICPINAIYNYILCRGSKPGPLFLAENKHPISAAQFTATLQTSVQVLGLDPQKYTPHSFRIGGASYAHENNVSEIHLKRLGRWRSTAYMRYIRGPALTVKDCKMKHK